MVEKKEFPIGTFKKKKNFYKCNGLLLVNNFKSKNFFIDFWRIGKKIIPPLNILFLIDWKI